MKKALFLILFTLLFLSASESVAEVKIPHEFRSGEVAKASEVNANFNSLKKAIELLQKRITELDTKNSSLEKENRALKESIAELKAKIAALEKRLGSLAASSQEEPRRQKVEVATEVTKGSKVWTDPITGMEFVWVPEGCFRMGCVSGIDCNDDEKPVHKVCLDGFWMGKYELTQAQWQKVMGNRPSSFKGDNHPVEQVSWNDVQKFLRRLNERAGKEIYRLPSEAEWEYAARAGTETTYSFGNDAGRLDEYAWYKSNSDGKTHPVGQLKPNAWGLYDMHGNVWEWCADPWHGDYKGAPADGSIWKAGGDTSRRLLRGGSWDINPDGCRAANRNWYIPDSTFLDIGFRVVVSGSRTLP